jgi:hypothetical protein
VGEAEIHEESAARGQGGREGVRVTRSGREREETSLSLSFSVSLPPGTGRPGRRGRKEGRGGVVPLPRVWDGWIHSCVAERPCCLGLGGGGAGAGQPQQQIDTRTTPFPFPWVLWVWVTGWLAGCACAPPCSSFAWRRPPLRPPPVPLGFRFRVCFFWHETTGARAHPHKLMPLRDSTAPRTCVSVCLPACSLSIKQIGSP